MSKKQKPIVSSLESRTTVDPMVSEMQEYTMDKTKSILSPYLNAKLKGYGVAGFNQDQQDAFAGMRGLVGGISPADVQGWMNPYMSDVVDTTTGRIQRQGDEALNAIRGRTAAGSAFGGVGARGALQAAKTQEGTQRQIAETTAQLMAQGYDRATATAISNQSLKAGALQGVLSIGGLQQELEQRKMDTPLRALQMLQSATPQQYSSSSSGTQTMPNTAPSPFQQVLGLAGTIGGAFIGGPMGAQIGGGLGGMAGRYF